jgi:tyrosinase
LKPFYADYNGNFHTSDSVRNLTVFGYTYPELNSGDPGDVRVAINSLYGDPQSELTKRWQSGPGASKKGYRQSKSAQTDPSGEKKYLREYLINIKTDRAAQNNSYTIRFFMGDFAPESQAWSKDPNLIGTQGIFYKQGFSIEPMLVTGVVPLTKSLRKAYHEAKFTSFSEDSVVAYLKQNLHWRIQRVREALAATEPRA